MYAREFFQTLRGFSAGEFVRAITKDFGQVAFPYDAVVLFHRRFWGDGIRNVFRPAAVAFTVADRLPRTN